MRNKTNGQMDVTGRLAGGHDHLGWYLPACACLICRKGLRRSCIIISVFDVTVKHLHAVRKK